MLLGFALHMAIRSSFIDYREKVDEYLTSTLLFTVVFSVSMTAIICSASVLADASQTGIYSLIYNFSMIATVITTSLDGVWVPWFTKKMNNKGYREINKVAVDYVNLMTYAMCCLIMVAPEVVKILASVR